MFDPFIIVYLNMLFFSDYYYYYYYYYYYLFITFKKTKTKKTSSQSFNFKPAKPASIFIKL